jgi:hypothetical protein
LPSYTEIPIGSGLSGAANSWRTNFLNLQSEIPDQKEVENKNFDFPEINRYKSVNLVLGFLQTTYHSLDIGSNNNFQIGREKFIDVRFR